MNTLLSKISFLGLICGVVLIISGCGGDGTPPYVPQDQAATAGTPVDTRPVSTAKLKILKPANEEILKTTRADIFFQTQDFELTGGNAIMVSVDNQPARKHAVRNAPFVITGLAEGGHTVIAYLVGPDDMMINSPDAKASVHFYIKQKDFQNFLGSGETTVTINQPRGTFSGANADNIVLDFKVSNPPAGYLVRYSLGGTTKTITSDGMVSLGSLAAGSYTLTLEILDAQGNPAPGNFSKAQTSFVVVRGTQNPGPAPSGNFQTQPTMPQTPTVPQ